MIARSGIRNRSAGFRPSATQRLDLLRRKSNGSALSYPGCLATELVARLDLFGRAVAVVRMRRRGQFRRDVGVDRRRAPTACTARTDRRRPAPRPTSGPASCSASTTPRYAASVERSTSVSSTRKTNVPPSWRANAQLNNAVRTVADVRVAGRGGCEAHAHGHRDSPDRDAPTVPTTVFVNVPIPSMVTDNLVAGHDRTDTGRRPGENDVTRQQGHRVTDERDELRPRRAAATTCARSV